MCRFCNETIYIQVRRFSAPILAPATETMALEYALLNKTGMEYVVLDKIFCPVCGEKLKEDKL